MKPTNRQRPNCYPAFTEFNPNHQRSTEDIRRIDKSTSLKGAKPHKAQRKKSFSLAILCTLAALRSIVLFPTFWSYRGLPKLQWSKFKVLLPSSTKTTPTHGSKTNPNSVPFPGGGPPVLSSSFLAIWCPCGVISVM